MRAFVRITDRSHGLGYRGSGKNLAQVIRCDPAKAERRLGLSLFRFRFLCEHDLVGKPVSTFPDHALLEHDLVGKPVSTFPDHALFEHDLFGKPVSTFPDHALMHRELGDLSVLGAALRIILADIAHQRRVGD